MDETDDDSVVMLNFNGESVPEALAVAVKNVLTSLETKNHTYEHSEEVGHLIANG